MRAARPGIRSSGPRSTKDTSPLRRTGPGVTAEPGPGCRPRCGSSSRSSRPPPRRPGRRPAGSPPPSAPGTPACRRTSITNTSTTTIDGWSLVFTLSAGQTVTAGWNADYSPASGQVTARNVAHNATIAPGASVDIGFQATHTGNAAPPSSYALNGRACAMTVTAQSWF
ncbi:cellulose binding domain-containing protein [Streptomyces sp. NPDC102259]|uniref:cellulose binding domain-containing protein n=1 Tax=Streptomyces sp. NPDC102259 TaxID=3366148 RepID=UPI00382108C5